VKKVGFRYLHTQVPIENTFGAIHSCYCSNDNPTVGEFVGALKTSIISGLAFKGLHETDCEDDATLLDKIQFLLRAPDASLPNVFTGNSMKTCHNAPDSFSVAKQLK
jgi:hypothetical protein